MIRKIDIADAEKALDMMTVFYHSPAVCHSIPKSYMRETIRQALANNPYLDIFVFEYDFEVAGYALFAYSYSNEAGGKVVWIEELYVDEKYRGKGLGKEFFEFVKQNFKDFARIRLEVDKDNLKAIKLYENTGFEVLPYIQYIIDQH